jgi:hypothetical protein
MWTQLELHERDEWLKYDGQNIIDPHPPLNMFKG